MTIKASSYPVAKACLVELLESVPDLQKLVTYGEPSTSAREFVSVLTNPTDSDETWASIGGQPREERYEIEVAIGVFLPGKTQREATERCEALFAAASAALREWPKGDQPAALSGIFASEITRVRRSEGPLPEGRAAGVQFVLRIQSRI